MQITQQTTEKSQPSTGATDILHAQQKSWNRFAHGWHKWDDFTMDFLRQQGAAIVEALDVEHDAKVLDVASGTGEPALTLASRAPNGRVTALDASSGMLEVARGKATARGLTNFVAREGDACALPFADASFDAISCRLGFMFFPDVDAAAREMHRVLKPGGLLATTVWAGPQHNPWITTLVGAIKRHLDFPSPPAGAPGMFRCADPDAFAARLRTAGFQVERSQLIGDTMRCHSVAQYWGFMNEVVAPVVATLQGADPSIVAAIEAEVRTTLTPDGASTPPPLAAGAHCFVVRK
ncbi:MAG: methyltransferase domain-containing protein [Myxococcales bacterium]|nr:methyltransferase domain-containing protein [Myxococcales bacterium]